MIYFRPAEAAAVNLTSYSFNSCSSSLQSRFFSRWRNISSRNGSGGPSTRAPPGILRLLQGECRLPSSRVAASTGHFVLFSSFLPGWEVARLRLVVWWRFFFSPFVLWWYFHYDSNQVGVLLLWCSFSWSRNWVAFIVLRVLHLKSKFISLYI